MKFISYAQNFEDVMLWRALKHVTGGFYVDIGAQHPTADSVSKAFYERGWRGIDVEPVPHYAQLLRDERPEDIVLELAISDRVGAEPLYVIPETGLSTLVRTQAERHRDSGEFQFIEVLTETRTLREVLAPYGERDVHWLKVDVEGLEEAVLRSWVGSTVMPWIFIVESTLPNETREVHHAWEATLTEAGYRFVYFDGLNRFYISQAHPELEAAFRTPPNVFDHFELSSVKRLEDSFIKAETYAKSLEEALERRDDAASAYTESLVEQAAINDEHFRTLQAALHQASAFAESLVEQVAEKDRQFALAINAFDGERAMFHERESEAAERFEALRADFKAVETYAKTLEDEITSSQASMREMQASFDEHRTASAQYVVTLEESRRAAVEYAVTLEVELQKMRAAADRPNAKTTVLHRVP